MSKFRVGDKVTAFGLVGKVTSVAPTIDSRVFPVQVEFDLHLATFTSDGRLQVWHKEPSLIFLEREEKKVEITKSQLVKAYENAYLTSTFSTQSEKRYMIEELIKNLGLED